MEMFNVGDQVVFKEENEFLTGQIIHLPNELSDFYIIKEGGQHWFKKIDDLYKPEDLTNVDYNTDNYAVFITRDDELIFQCDDEGEEIYNVSGGLTLTDLIKGATAHHRSHHMV